MIADSKTNYDSNGKVLTTHETTLSDTSTSVITNNAQSPLVKWNRKMRRKMAKLDTRKK